MKAIILTAGYGKRMRPLTYHTHKTLLKIADKTIIGRIIDGLSANGITNIIIVTGYRQEELTNYLTLNYPDLNFSFVHNSRYAQTNNIYSMALAFEAIDIDDDIILIESDLIYEPTVIERAVNSIYPNVALVDKFRSGMDGTVVTVADGNIISQIIPPHLQDSNFDFSDKYKTLNIYKFSEGFCNTIFKDLLSYYARTIDENSYYELVLGILIYMQREVIYAEVLDGEKWAEVDDPNDLRVAEYVFNVNKRQEILETASGGYWSHDVLDFRYIRNMYFPNGSIISELKNNLPNLLDNYSSKQTILNQKLAYFLYCNKENLNVLNGASEIYPIIKDYFAGKKGLIPKPTFSEYGRVFDSQEGYFIYTGIDTADFEKRATECDVTVIVNPNNPTGALLQTEWVYQFATRHSEKTIIIDETFIEFSSTNSIIPLLEKQPLENIIVIKNLSESLGVPGLRLGYAYSCNQSFNKYVRDELPFWSVNSMAEYILEIILKHRKSLEQSYQNTIRDRDLFAADLSRLSFIEKVYPSEGNFLLVSFKENPVDYARVIDRMLAEYSIYIEDISNKLPEGKTFIRLAVRLPEENSILVESLNNCVEALKKTRG